MIKIHEVKIHPLSKKNNKKKRLQKYHVENAYP